jgi:hypothetical protein
MKKPDQIRRLLAALQDELEIVEDKITQRHFDEYDQRHENYNPDEEDDDEGFEDVEEEAKKTLWECRYELMGVINAIQWILDEEPQFDSGTLTRSFLGESCDDPL